MKKVLRCNSALFPLSLLSLPVLICFPAFSQTTFIFSDNFDSDKGWQDYEEIVGGNTDCYQDNIGFAHRSEETLEQQEESVMLVFANEAESTYSNHVIAQNRLLDAGPSGIWEYSFRYYAELNALEESQSHPEFSLQNTHPIALDWASGAPVPEWRTHTAGLQYIGNKWDYGINNDRKWRIWTIANTGQIPESEVAAWQDIPISVLPEISLNGWYQLKLKVDFTAKQYLSLAITAPDGTSSDYDLSSWPIAREVKWFESAFWATLEAENLWACGSGLAFDTLAIYDDVEVKQIEGSIPNAPLAENLWLDMFAQQSSTLYLTDLASDDDDNLLASTTTLLSSPQRGNATVNQQDGSITYQAKQSGGDSFKYRVCDETFLCAEAWVTINSPNRPPVGATTWVSANAGDTVEIPNPISDPDGNLDSNSRYISVAPAYGSADLLNDNAFQYTAPEGFTGEVGFHVTACDVPPWGYCAGAWIVVNVE